MTVFFVCNLLNKQSLAEKVRIFPKKEALYCYWKKLFYL